MWSGDIPRVAAPLPPLLSTIVNLGTMAPPLLLLLLLLLPAPCTAQVAAFGCEAQCAASCYELNGNVEHECGRCPEEAEVKCKPGAPGFDDWQARSGDWSARTRGLPEGRAPPRQDADALALPRGRAAEDERSASRRRDARQSQEDGRPRRRARGSDRQEL